MDKIAYSICMAQMASDAAKRITWDSELFDSWNDHRDRCDAESKGYAMKDYMILRAIHAIIKSKTKNYHFFVTDGEITPYLVYFNFKVEGKRYQVSFHSFCDELNKFYRTGAKIRWDEKSSRDACVALAKSNGFISSRYGGDAL